MNHYQQHTTTINNPKYPPTNKYLRLQKNKCHHWLIKELSHRTVGAGGYRTQLYGHITHTTYAKSLTSYYNARTMPS